MAESGGAAEQIDVAISFLSRDQEIAQQLFDSLMGLKVFFFPRNQEDLAGTDGMETMRTPFMEARVVVVLFRLPWGQTPWTRVEETAVKDRCLNKGWQGLLFVQLDKTHVHPVWLPQTHVRYNVEEFALAGLTSVIKARVLEQGGTIKKVDALTEAARIRRETDHNQLRESLMGNSAWISDLRKSIVDLYQEVVRLAREIASAHGWPIVAGFNPEMCALRCDHWISMHIRFRQPFSNTVAPNKLGDSYLQAAEISGGIHVPGDNSAYPFQTTVLREHKFVPDVSAVGQLFWKEQGGPETIQPADLADRILQLYVSMIGRAKRGEIEPPFA
jgi:hypothetical protein